jgi:hypothetical protein
MNSTAPIKVMDIDGELDIPQLLGESRTLMLFRFLPAAGGGINSEYAWTWSDGNELVLRPQGGDEYKRPVWDYSKPFSVHTWTGSYHYEPDTRTAIDPNFQIVLLRPIGFTWGPFLWGTQNLQRFQPVKAGWYSHRDSTNTYVSRTGSWVGATIPNVAMCNAQLRVSTLTNKELENMTSSSIERLFRALQVPDAPVAALHAHSFFVDNQELPAPSLDVVTYSYTEPLVLEIPQPTLRQVGKPVLPGYSPASGVNSDVAMISGRITGIRNVKTHYKRELWEWMEEFVTFIVPDPGSGTPLTVEKVDLLQDRRVQRATFARDRAWFPWMWSEISSFQKREAYQEIKDPRNISTFDTHHRVELSQYSYAFVELLKFTKWYGFGMNPMDVAGRVCELAEQCEDLADGDYSRWDGRLAALHQVLQRHAFLRYFPKAFHQHLIKLLDEEWSELGTRKARTAHGLNYAVGSSRTSGSAITSLGNTLNNAFEKYCAWRLTGLPAQMAYDRLGIYGGDDSLDRGDLPQTAIETITKWTGTVIKWNIRKRGDPIPFLGRFYLDPWVSNSNCIDIKRQLRKLHLTTAPRHVSVEEVLRRKALAYRVTDPHTPILGDWATHVLRLTNGMTLTSNEFDDCSYHYQQFKQPENWRFDELDQTLACEQNGLEPQTVARYVRRFARATTIQEMLVPLDEDLVESPPGTQHDNQINDEQPKLDPFIVDQITNDDPLAAIATLFDDELIEVDTVPAPENFARPSNVRQPRSISAKPRNRVTTNPSKSSTPLTVRIKEAIPGKVAGLKARKPRGLIPQSTPNDRLKAGFLKQRKPPDRKKPAG